jgi:hypothetical protein
MPEEQVPFIHEDGTRSPAVVAGLNAFLRPTTLEALVKSLRNMAEGSRRNANGSLFELLTRSAFALDAAATILEWERTPSINSTIAALLLLPPNEQAIVSDAAVQLLEAGAKRHRLVLELRTVLEKAS